MATTKRLDVSDAVRQIILDMEWGEGGTLGKLTQQLDRKTYLDVNKMLEKLGGKWNRKMGGHLFEHDPRPALAPLEEGNDLTIDVWGYFQTPPAVVNRILELMDAREGDLILEPSAGSGAILAEALRLPGSTAAASTPSSFTRAAPTICATRATPSFARTF